MLVDSMELVMVRIGLLIEISSLLSHLLSAHNLMEDSCSISMMYSTEKKLAKKFVNML
jgi:hypothetical protein